ncbi:C-factor [Tetrabaena socialis]|uniref:C-factor n=1 Tax=Tetrabaena socialis TaxID=47790 RepID=A0A2J8AAM8_9CHLO|nr:C-factor [Tetrabaena socialis]|eukprot:PNH09567.1 C-factor [Tetrabaena socialis]
MVIPITGKTVVVTGGSRYSLGLNSWAIRRAGPIGIERSPARRGIGLGLVKKLLARENVVIATSRSSADAAHLLALRTQYGDRLQLTDLDTTATSSIAAWAEEVKRRTKHVDLLVNNAGVYGKRPNLEDFTEEDFLFAFRTNAMGPFFVVQQLLKQARGRALPRGPGWEEWRELLGPPGSLIVNISSIVGSNTDPTVSATSKGGYAYRASKAALNIISTTLARDLAEQRITCVALHPGYVRTDLTGGNGWVDVEESAGGMVDVLESGEPLNGRFLSYKGEEIPW